VEAYVKKDYFGHPQLYQLPSPPSGWSIGTMDQRVETIMGFQVSASMGIFDGKRERIEKSYPTYDRISSVLLQWSQT
jgi:hypothetical protein